MEKDTRVCTLFENAGIFSADTLEKRLNALLKMTAQEGGNTGVFDWDGTPLTAAQLWERYFIPKQTDSLRGYLNGEQKTQNAENSEKNTRENKTPVFEGISGEKAVKIEEIGGGG